VDVDTQGRRLLTATNVFNETDMLAKGESKCDLPCCKHKYAHRLNRCTEIWHATDAGRARAGKLRADERVDRAIRDSLTVGDALDLLQDISTAHDAQDAHDAYEVCALACARLSITEDMPAGQLDRALAVLATDLA